jgi:hypothetical protein
VLTKKFHRQMREMILLFEECDKTASDLLEVGKRAAAMELLQAAIDTIVAIRPYPDRAIRSSGRRSRHHMRANGALLN